MAKTGRDRASGWQHAKLDGHVVENRMAAKVEQEPAFRTWLLDQCGVPASQYAGVTVGGLHEKHVPSVHGDSITGKVDMVVNLTTGKLLKFSIKKSGGGQAWWLNTERFIEAYEQVYAEKIPANVQKFIAYFIHCDTEAVLADKPYLGGGTKKRPCLEKHQKRLSYKTICAHFPEVARDGMAWFQAKTPRLVELIFSRGSCSETDDHADWLLYFFGEGNHSVHSVAQMIAAVEKIPLAERVVVGPRNGGTTLLFPFGFLQMHQGKVQFHHGFGKVEGLVKK